MATPSRRIGGFPGPAILSASATPSQTEPNGTLATEQAGRQRDDYATAKESDQEDEAIADTQDTDNVLGDEDENNGQESPEQHEAEDTDSGENDSSELSLRRAPPR